VSRFGLPRRLLLGAALAPVAAQAAGTVGGGRVPEVSAFAEHRLALQLSEREPHRQDLVLSVANNVLKAYGPDKVAIEVVAFGPGIDLLRAESPRRSAVDSLVAQGVRFDLCLNTVETIARETGQRPALNPHAIPVEAGVVQLMTLAEAGYILVRP
jgi:intracellular sulfur oxidation DsrE/DsrF family protein